MRIKTVIKRLKRIHKNGCVFSDDTEELEILIQKLERLCK